jgi:hypothetical protein
MLRKSIPLTLTFDFHGQGKLSLCIIKHCARKTYAGEEIELLMYLTLELDGAA